MVIDHEVVAALVVFSDGDDAGVVEDEELAAVELHELD